MSWNQHDWDASVHDQNASTHWQNGNNIEHWNSIFAAESSRNQAQWQREDEARVAAHRELLSQPIGMPQQSFPTYVGGYSSSPSAPPGPGWDVAWWLRLRAWGRGIIKDFRIFRGHPLTENAEPPSIGRRLWIAIRSPFTFSSNLLKTILGLPFAILFVLLRAIALLIKALWFVIKIAFVLLLTSGLGLWGAHAAGLWDGTVPPTVTQWVNELAKK